MNAATDFLAIILGGITLASVIVGVVFYSRSEVTKKTIESLKHLAEALEKRVDALEEEREAMRTRIDTLEKENDILRSMVGGETKAIEMISLSQRNHDEVMEILESIREEIK